jgi:peptidoglycan/LPS O-acetylase OafA/YrhL
MRTGEKFTNLIALDALRGMLAIYVLIGHARWLLWAGHSAWLVSSPIGIEWVLGYVSAVFRYGHEAVMFFFVLSGFFIHSAYARASSKRYLSEDGLRNYYRRRARRLIPTYVFALLITVVLDAIGRAFWPDLYLAHISDALLKESFTKKTYDVDSVFFGLVLLPSLGGKDFGSNGPLWSIANEAVYYAIYPLWLRLRHTNAALGYVAVPALCWSIASLPLAGPLTQLIGLYPVWLAGAFVSEWIIDGKRRSLLNRWSAVFVVAVGVLLVAFAKSHWILGVCGLIVLSAMTVYTFARMPAYVSENGWVKVWAFLGLRSYSIYLVHFPLLALFSAALLQQGGSRPLHGWVALLGALAAVVFGVACFYVCERFFLTRERVTREIAKSNHATSAERP